MRRENPKAQIAKIPDSLSVLVITTAALLALALGAVAIPAATAAGIRRIHLTSPAFKTGQRMPRLYTADGADISPPLAWGRVPHATRSIMITMIDPDAPGPTPFVHWLIFNIPPTVHRLAAGVPRLGRLLRPRGAVQGRNSFGGIGYGGPAPPAGSAHHYHLRIYALDIRLAVRPASAAASVYRALPGHILARGSIVLRYGR